MSWKLQGVVKTQDLGTVFVRSATAAWAGGMGGALLHWNGSAWNAVVLPTTGQFAGIFGVPLASTIWGLTNVATGGTHQQRVFGFIRWCKLAGDVERSARSDLHEDVGIGSCCALGGRLELAPGSVERQQLGRSHQSCDLQLQLCVGHWAKRCLGGRLREVR